MFVMRVSLVALRHGAPCKRTAIEGRSVGGTGVIDDTAGGGGGGGGGMYEEDADEAASSCRRGGIALASVSTSSFFTCT